MIITEEILDGLTEYYVVAQGLTPGIFGSYEIVRKLIEGFPNNKHKRFGARRPAVRWLAEKLSEIAQARTLNPEEQETLDSCNKLIGDWPPETIWPSMI